MSTNRFIEASKAFTKKIKFLGQDLEITKLSVGQVIRIQDLAKAVEKAEDKSEGHIDMLFQMVRMGAPELSELDDNEMSELPMEELSDLSNEIMKHSGLGNKSK